MGGGNMEYCQIKYFNLFMETPAKIYEPLMFTN